MTDRGWSWVVLFATSIIQVVLGLVYCVGVFNVIFLEVYQKDKQTTAWLGAVQTSLLSLLGPLAGYLDKRLGSRTTGIVGGLFGSLGFFLAYFSASYTYHIITYSLLVGIGYALAHLPCYVMIGYYFNRYRAMAFGIMCSMVGVGTMVIPSIIAYCNEQYGWRGCMLIMSGMYLHIVPAAALLRPPKISMIHTDLAITDPHLDPDLSVPDNPDPVIFQDISNHVQLIHDNRDPIMVHDNHDQLYSDMAISERQEIPDESGPVIYSDPDLGITDLQEDPVSALLRPHRVSMIPDYPDIVLAGNNSDTTKSLMLSYGDHIGVSDSEIVANMDRSGWHCTSLNDHKLSNIKSYSLDDVRLATYLKNKLYNRNITRSEEHLKYLNDERTHPEGIVDGKNESNIHLNKTPQWWRILTNKYLILLNLNLILVNASTFIGIVHFPDYFYRSGMTQAELSLLMMLIGLSNITCRLLSGALTTNKEVSILLVYISGCGLAGIIILLCPLLSKSVAGRVIFALGFGFYGNTSNALTGPLTLTICPLSDLSMAYGIELFSCGISILMAPPFAGWLFDVSGSYAISFMIAGTMCMVGSLLLMFIPIIGDYDENIKQSSAQSKESTMADEKRIQSEIT